MSGSIRLPLAMLLAAVHSCTTAPPPLAFPEQSPVVGYSLRWPDPASEATTAGPARTFTVELLAVRDAPTGTAIGQAAEAIIRDRGMPFRGRSRLPIGTRWLADAEAEQWHSKRSQRDASQLQELGSTTAIVTQNLITSLQVDLAGVPIVMLTVGAADPAALEVADADAADVVVMLLSPASDDAPREGLLVAATLPARTGAVLFVPDQQLAPGGHLLSLRPAAAPTADQIAEAEQLATGTGEAVDPLDRPLAWQVALQAVGADNRRPALLALTSPLGLLRVVDVLLAVDEAALIAITDELKPIDPGAPDVAWQVERATWRALLPRMRRSELTAAMLAAVIRHLGAIADDPSTMQLLLHTSADCDAFATALRDENLAALDDRSAAVRVTAHGWLDDRRAAVANYAPLADKSARRLALLRYWRDRTTGGQR